MIVETANVPVETCDRCGESFAGPEAARIRHQALGKALGLLTPAEIAAIREQVGLTQAVFANLFGVREVDVSRWELGRAWPDRAADNLLRVLSEHPEMIQLLKGVADPAPDPAQVTEMANP